MNHIVDTCPLTNSEGGLNLLHEADDSAVIRLESTATAALADSLCIKWLAGWLIHSFIHPFGDWFIDQFIIRWLIYWFMDWLIYSLIDLFMTWLPGVLYRIQPSVTMHPFPLTSPGKWPCRCISLLIICNQNFTSFICWLLGKVLHS